MNQKEWKKSGKFPGKYEWYNKTRKIQKSLRYNNDPKANRIHHLRDTEEQRNYNDTHYEYWGFNEDGTFEYGKYVIFVTEEWHNNYHKDSDETRQKKSKASIDYWSDPENREYHSLISKLQWNDEKRLELSMRYTGEGNQFYGKHHSKEVKEKYFIGENNPMYGKHHSEEAKRVISEANKGKVVSQETRDKLSKASSGENNGMFGKHSDPHCADKAVELQKLASIAYREYRSNGATTKWQDFRREFFKLNR